MNSSVVCAFSMGLVSSIAVGSSGFITVGNDGGTYDYDNITDAIGAAQNFGSLISVYPGTYAEGPIDFGGKSVQLRAVDGPSVTFLEPASTGRVLLIDSGEGIGTGLDGFTIRNGSTTGSGGGLLVANESRVVIEDCRFISNSADFRGGGLYVDSESLAFITDCSFGFNDAGTTGGGLHLQPIGGCTVERCRFYGNTAVEDGGGAHVGSGGVLGELDPPMILNSSFSGNEVTGESGTGGGATIVVATAFIGSPPQLVGRGGAFGCTFVDNIADSLPAISGGLDGKSQLDVAVINCIITNNTGSLVSNTWIEPNWYYCCVDFLDSGSANAAECITQPPRFLDRLGEDAVAGTGDEILALEIGSPCIDAGYTYPSKTSELNGSLDLAGVTRVLDDPLTDDEGFGGPPVVDIGAYEFVIDDFDQLNVCWWTGEFSGGSLFDSGNWYQGLAAAPGRKWIVEDIVEIEPEQLTTTIGPLQIGNGWFYLTNSGVNVKTLRLAATNFPLYVPADLDIIDADGYLTTSERLTLRCRDINIERGGEFQPFGGVQLSGTLTNSGSLSLRSDTLARVGVSTEPLLVNLGSLSMSQTAITTVIDGDFQQGGALPDGTEVNGSLSLFVGEDSSLLEVTGTATLQGGIDVNTEANVGTFSDGDTFTFLTADDGFGGTSFDFVVTRGAILSEELFFVQQTTESFSQGGGMTGTSGLLVVSAASLLAGASETEGIGLTLQDMILADIDGDGFDDLVLSVDSGVGVDGSVVVLLNQGASGATWDGFEAYSGSTFSVNVGRQPRGLDVGYVVEDDGSSRLDVVVANYEDGTITVLTNSSTVGSVALSDTIGPIDSDPDFPSSSFPLDVCVKNLDLDAAGLSDILVTNERDWSVWAFQNTSSLLGTSVGNAEKSQPVKGIARFSPGRGGSGRDDDTTGSSSEDDGVSSGGAGAGVGGGILMTWNSFDTPVGSAPADLAIADFNGDTFQDIATVNEGDASISIFLGTGLGAYGPQNDFALDVGYSLPISLTAGDIDGDGDYDITYICTKDEDLSSEEQVSKILRNTLAAPGGSFGWVVETADDLSGQAPYLVRARDLDNDGVDDVVTLTATTSFANGPSFGFAAPVANDEDGCPGDFNDDGVVGGDDLARILGSWGTNDPEVELSGDEIIDGTDLAIILGEWGACSGGGAFD